LLLCYERKYISTSEYEEMKFEIERAVASTPVAYDAAQYVFTKERLPAVANEGMMMIDGSAGDDALHGFDLVGMDRRLNGVGNLFQNANLCEGDMILVFADKAHVHGVPLWLCSANQVTVPDRPKSIEVTWYEPFVSASDELDIFGSYYRCNDRIPTSKSIISHDSVILWFTPKAATRASSQMKFGTSQQIKELGDQPRFREYIEREFPHQVEW
jgi:hypothetical protein